MSGNFVQRGAPAIIDKHLRAKLAVQNGASLVLELPALYATQSADLFAKGAVEILKVWVLSTIYPSAVKAEI